MKQAVMPPIPAYEDVIRLLRVVGDPEAYAESLGRLEALRTEINASIQGRERLSKLDALEAEAANALANARARLEEAKAEADRLRAEAADEAKDLRAKVAAERKSWEAARKLSEAKILADAKRVDDTARATSEMAQKAAADRERAELLAKQADAVRTEYEAKLKQLRGLVA